MEVFEGEGVAFLSFCGKKKIAKDAGFLPHKEHENDFQFSPT